MSDYDQTYGLIVSFEDQSHSYVHGFEAGLLSARMNGGLEAQIEATVHTENRETIRRMALAYGWEVQFEPTEVEGWLYVVLDKTKPISTQPNPHGLRIVK